MSSVEEKELKRLNSDLNELSGKLTTVKKDYEAKFTSYNNLLQSNNEQKAQQWEVKIEDLETQLRKSERLRIQSQMNLENFHSTLQLKLNMLNDPHDDIAAPAKEYFTQKRDKINLEVKQRAE